MYLFIYNIHVSLPLHELLSQLQDSELVGISALSAAKARVVVEAEDGDLEASKHVLPTSRGPGGSTWYLYLPTR